MLCIDYGFFSAIAIISKNFILNLIGTVDLIYKSNDFTLKNDTYSPFETNFSKEAN
jgi:hypothetical protein